MIKNTKLFITSILVLFVFKINAKEFTYKSTGTLERNEVITFPGGGKFISFKHSGGFETNIDKYGKYQCKVSYMIIILLLKICILPANLKIKMGMFL